MAKMLKMKKRRAENQAEETETPNASGAPASAMVSAAAASNDTTGGGEDAVQIARLAYSYWEARGGVGGSPEDDWLRAQQELRAQK
jgi:hypothetical protein